MSGLGGYTGGMGTGANTSESDAIETARHEWQRMYRAEQAAGREVPVVEVPREYADDSFRASADATAELSRLGSRHSYMVGIDLRSLEAKRRATEARTTQRRKRPDKRRRKKG